MKKMTPTATIGQLSSDPKVAVEQIEACFRASIDEAQALSRKAAWVVCFARDFCPMRTDGREIRMFGGNIWTSASQTEAREVAKQLDAKANTGEYPCRIIALDATEWAGQRTAKLERMIAEVRGNFAKQA